MRAPRGPIVLVAVGLLALLALGATSAFARGGGIGLGLGGQSTNALLTEAAKRLEVSADTLKGAITNAAIARIDEAVSDGDLEAEDADDLKDEARENVRFAMLLSRTRTVAANLGKTTTQLNGAFRDARKARALARVDEAVSDGDLEAEDAAKLKERIQDARFPGYKLLGFGFGFGLGARLGGFGFPFAR
jgi:hypothetical protein